MSGALRIRIIRHVTKRTFLLSLNVILFAFLSSACAAATQAPTTKTNTIYELAAPFLDLYEALGGSDVFGIPISPPFSEEEITYQYLAAGLFSYNAAAPLQEQIMLEPIGRELDTVFSLSTTISSSEIISVYPGFEEFYQKLGGEIIVGKPITAIQHNDDQGRIEQHFENLGIYQLDSDPQDRIRLLNYGVWMCSQLCNFSSPSDSVITNITAVAQPFSAAILELTPQFLGRPLSNPYITSTQQFEQIFYNVILTAPVDDPSAIRLLPITEALEISAERNIEIQIAEELSPYVLEHGGTAVIGNPITPFVAQGASLFRQCFTNLCLDYLPNAIDGQQVRPTPLGYLYRQRIMTNEYVAGGKQTEIQSAIHTNLGGSTICCPKSATDYWRVYLQKW